MFSLSLVVWFSRLAPRFGGGHFLWRSVYTTCRINGMSADNYYRVCRHPAGGFTAVMGFMSNDEQPQPTANSPQFDTWQDAYAHANEDWIIEYGIRVDHDCLEPSPEPAKTRPVHEVIRSTLDDAVMQETGRSVGDLASGRVATAIMNALRTEGYWMSRDVTAEEEATNTW